MPARKLIIALAALLTVAAAGTAGAETYKRPAGEIIDAFRKPATQYSAGNRGWELQTKDGDAVKPAAAGTVTFAGQVGGTLNVVVRHSDGILTTYSRLKTVAVSKGDQVDNTTVLGTAGQTMYFGARRNGQYIDPETLFDFDVVLVPVDG